MLSLPKHNLSKHQTSIGGKSNGLTRSRKISQWFFFALFVYILWSTTYPLTGKLPPETYFQADPLIMFGTALSERLMLSGLIGAGGMVLAGLLLGRFFCGWICPLGTVIDTVGSCRPRQGSEEQNKRWRRQRGLKFLLLAVIAVFALAGIQIAWVLDPLVLMARFVSLNFIPTVTLALDTCMMLLIRGFKLYGPVYDFYNILRSSVLGVKVSYFSNAAVIFAAFVLVSGSTLLAARWWCRLVCPLGALYGCLSRVAWLRRTVKDCVFCGQCRPACPTDAIKPDMSYDPAECILCMECVYACPAHITRFELAGWTSRGRAAVATSRPQNEKGISRRSFLVLLASGVGAAMVSRRQRQPAVRADSILIRPPGALEEPEFLNRCIRCGNCMKVCPTNGLQPLLFYPSIDALWTPQLAADIGYCEYNCTQCGTVCPTGAIPRLDLKRKQQTKLGIAKIDRHLCIPYAKKKSCIVCEEHCPVPQKAIKLTRDVVDGVSVLKPLVDEKLCIGCGICQTKCPVGPVRAIKMFAFGSDRTPAG